MTVRRFFPGLALAAVVIGLGLSEPLTLTIKSDDGIGSTIEEVEIGVGSVIVLVTVDMG